MTDTLHSKTGAQASSDCTAADDPRRWREAPLAKRVFILHNLMMRIGDRLVADLGLTSSRWLLLGAVADRPEPPTLSELSGDAVLSLQNVSRMVAAMEQDGLLVRSATPGGGRGLRVRLTDRGRALHEQTKRRAERFAAAFLLGIPREGAARLEADFERLIGNLEKLETELLAVPSRAVSETLP
jgi:DNA-binding MarR family transcriptional regulator